MNQSCSLGKSDTLITVASWEERFLIGTQRLIEQTKPATVLMFFYEKYAKWSSANRKETEILCDKTGISLQTSQLSFAKPLQSWQALVAKLDETIRNELFITIDITTMPREAIWTICHQLSCRHKDIQYVYHQPREYGEWLSRDPLRPRLVYEMSGLSTLGKSTTLVVLTGYDVERTKQLIRFYEPEDILLGLQVGEQFESIERNRTEHRDKLTRNKDIKWFDIDGYSVKDSLTTLEEYVSPFLAETNVILSSLGPKVGALALYRFHQLHPETALSYAPSNEFNKDYSHGIQGSIAGELQLSTDPS